MKLVTLATCNLDQWALDFDGNLSRIAASIRLAKEAGARYRLGPELEIPGYGCEDAFLEGDTIRHAWEVLAELLDSDLTDGILCDLGMPLLHHGVRYNCRVFALNRKLLLIRPKMALADDGNYRESRWFAAWPRERTLEPHPLPRIIQAVTEQQQVPFGDGALATRDAVIASETCEELFAPQSPHLHLGLGGVEIIANGSASHHELRKLDRRLELIRSATRKHGGIYLYANQQGCDGGRLYYDGSAMIALNGELVAQGSQFSPRDVEVVTATVDLEAVRSYRAAMASRNAQASRAAPVPRVHVDFDLVDDAPRTPSAPQPARYPTPEEEIALGPACWLWDYLRRSGLQGFLLPLSGGADSAAVAAVVGSMCQLVLREARAGTPEVLADLRRLLRPDDPDSDPTSWLPADARELAGKLLHTCYLATAASSEETRQRAARIAADVGARHHQLDLEPLVQAGIELAAKASGSRPRFRAHGGSAAEDLALQNLQARSRMVTAYLLAQLLPGAAGASRSNASPGRLLVLGTANVDEALFGYLTKYDNSSADLNPIGAIAKLDLRRFLRWAADHLGYPSLAEVAAATPTAELEPSQGETRQSDEADMGLSYAELARIGHLRKVERCGPLAMFERLVNEWVETPPREVAAKVKHFFRHYAANRHKATVLTPAYHAESYSPEDHRFDLRQFLYDLRWARQFRRIDQQVVVRECLANAPEHVTEHATERSAADRHEVPIAQESS